MLYTPNALAQLNTKVTGPLHFLEKHFLKERNRITEWFAQQWQLTAPPVYGSVDLRNAGFKLAPIDMNLFPAGFNNLNRDFMPISVAAAKKIIQKISPNTKRILILPESHTRNLFYWSNVKTLQHILEQAGFETRLGILNNGETPSEILLGPSEKLSLYPLERKNDHLMTSDFDPDFILLNNDLSEGIPDILQNLTQTIYPPAQLGWSNRLKSEHFQYYSAVTQEFAELLQMDAWLIDPLFRHCGQIDFMQQSGAECLLSQAEYLFAEIQKKYDEYNIPYQPFLVVKADAGTYGMAVMTVRHIDELKTMNRKQRTKMSMSKGGQPVNRVIIQEGVYTFETLGEDQATAEPVVYLWGESVVGGFYRVHKDRSVDENLNAPGMKFEPIAFAGTCQEPCVKENDDPSKNLFFTYGIVAKLSMLAAAREIKDTQK